MSLRKFLLSIATILLFLPVILVQADSSQDPSLPPEKRGEARESLSDADILPTDQIIIKFKYSDIRTLDEDDVRKMMPSLSASVGQTLNFLRTMSDDAHVLKLEEKRAYNDVLIIAQSLTARDDVEYAEPDRILQHTLTPNDPGYQYQWHYTKSTSVYGINLPAAWDITTGSSSVVVAVIDTGITNHTDLSGKTVSGYDFVSNTWMANDGNGRDSDPSDPGDWVTANQCGEPHDAENSSWHGTHVAGTIGANTNNGVGVAGVSWGARILPVRVLGRCGGYDSDIIDGMRWSAGLSVAGVPTNANPAQVLNLSLGGEGACTTSWQSAIDDVRNAGATVVVAAGNEDDDAANYSPANCSGVVTVGATDRDGWWTSYTNYGSTLEISAPGGDFNWDTGILSTLNTGTTTPEADSYVYYQGTSMAAPHISGIAALMLSVEPNLIPDAVLSILEDTAGDFNPGNTGCTEDNLCGEGIADAGAALSLVDNPDIKAQIGSNVAGLYSLSSGSEIREYYDISDGPVVVENVKNANIVAAIRLQSKEGPTAPLYSFIETMGVPQGLLSYKYYFPTYNNTWAPLNSQVRFGNINTTATTIRVTIGNDVVWEQSVPAQEERRLYFARSGGPVIIESLDPSKKIVAAIRLQSKPVGSPLYSFSETLGIPAEKVSDTYYFPTYNNTWAPLNSQLRVGNLNAADTTVRITIGGTVVWQDTVPGFGEKRLYFAVSGGPVKVESLDPAKKIVAAIRLQSKEGPTAPLYSFVETMGVPEGLLSYKYYFPTYNNTWSPLNSQIRFGNLDTAPTTIRVTIGGNVVWQQSVPGQEERRLYFDVSGGPVIVESLDSSKKIAAAIRLQSKPAGSPLYSFSETLGIPAGEMADTYYFPTYNNTWDPLNSQLRFGMP